MRLYFSFPPISNSSKLFTGIILNTKFLDHYYYYLFSISLTKSKSEFLFYPNGKENFLRAKEIKPSSF